MPNDKKKTEKDLILKLMVNEPVIIIIKLSNDSLERVKISVCEELRLPDTIATFSNLKTLLDS